MKILAIQSATATGGVALYDPGNDFECKIEIPLNKRLSKALAPAVKDILECNSWVPADIELCVCASGPGSFTGLRVGMALVKGFALSIGCSVKTVPTLDILYHSYADYAHPIVALIDARSERAYYAEYRATRDGDYSITAQPGICELSRIPAYIEWGYEIICPDRSFLGDTVGEEGLKPIGEIGADPLVAAKIADYRFGENGGDEPSVITPVYLKSGQV